MYSDPVNDFFSKGEISKKIVKVGNRFLKLDRSLLIFGELADMFTVHFTKLLTNSFQSLF